MSIINPKVVLDKYLKGAPEHLIAQNGIDLPMAKLYRLDHTTTGQVNGKVRKFPKRLEMIPIDGEYILYPGFYEFTTDIEVSIPTQAAGLIIPRSSLLRNGIFVTSGVWDSGFSGKLSGFLNNTTCLVALGVHERVGQFLMFSAEAHQLYNGFYQNTGSTLEVQTVQPPGNVIEKA